MMRGIAAVLAVVSLVALLADTREQDWPV